MTYNYHFDWDNHKAARNLRKHNVSFEWAITVFSDPLMLSMLDDEHSTFEERWITLGMATNHKLLVIIHTHQDINPQVAQIRIISARFATKHEQHQYEHQS